MERNEIGKFDFLVCVCVFIFEFPQKKNFPLSSSSLFFTFFYLSMAKSTQSKNNFILLFDCDEKEYVWLALVFEHDLNARIFSHRPLAPSEIYVFKNKKLADEFEKKRTVWNENWSTTVRCHRLLIKTSLEDSMTDLKRDSFCDEP